MTEKIKAEFSHKEVQILCEALCHLHIANVEYLKWKTDKFSQEQIPIHIQDILELYWKVGKLRT